jgi:hypothetical protein
MAPFVSRFASALVVLAAIATPRVQAWGPIGHEVAASLAMKYLSSAAVSQLQDILSEEPGAGDLVQVWPFSLPFLCTPRSNCVQTDRRSLMLLFYAELFNIFAGKCMAPRCLLLSSSLSFSGFPSSVCFCTFIRFTSMYSRKCPRRAP